MPLTGTQITALVQVIEAQWDPNTLTLFASDRLNFDLAKRAPGGDLNTLATKLVTDNSLPPEDSILLEALARHGNAAIRAAAAELLKPSYFSPTSDPHDAIILGRTAFVNRENLRASLRTFTSAATRVLVIRGREPGGKSYSWQLLRPLAWEKVGAVAHRLQLKNDITTPLQLVRQAFSLLDLDAAKLPPMADEPQQAHVGPLVAAFKGQIVKLAKPYWLVIDDLNEVEVPPVVQETAYALAKAVEETQPPNLWIALLGYNAEITDEELRWVAQDDARFFDAAHLAAHLQSMALVGPKKLTPEEAREIADLEMARFPELTRGAMSELTKRVEVIGERLKAGQKP